ncbi:MAG: DUF4136 domain-containing protein [Deltaproteobacteria bacterium]|nr:DUF4136 domain-containing protein [Deltaproteobacteria bacterium]
MPHLRSRFIIIVSLLVTFSLAVSHCSTALSPLDPVKTDFDPDIDFKRYRIFGWNDPHRDSPLPIDPWLETFIEKEISRVFQAKGFTIVKGDRPDLLVSYDVIAEQQIVHQTLDSAVTGDPRYPTIPIASGVRIHTLRRAAFVINLVEPTTKEVLWSGMTSGEIDFMDPKRRIILWTGSPTGEVEQKAQPQRSRERISEAVETILAEFPPK